MVNLIKVMKGKHLTRSPRKDHILIWIILTEDLICQSNQFESVPPHVSPWVQWIKESFFRLTTSYPYLETSSMVVMSATDTLYTHTCNHRDEEVFLQSWRDELAQLARNMTSTKPDFGFFLENCSFHTVLGNVGKYHYQQVKTKDL